MNHRRPTDLNRFSGYTRGRVRTLLRPLTFCVILLFGVGPAATLACELACSAPSGHAHHQSNHHEHTSQGAEVSHATGEKPVVSPFAPACDHAIAVAPAVTSMAVKMLAPAATQALIFVSPDSARSDIRPFGYAIGGPPGLRSGPISLRI